MTTRISLRPASAAVVLIPFVVLVAVVLGLLGVAQAGSSSVDARRPPVSSSSVQLDGRHPVHTVQNQPVPTVSVASHRTSVQTGDRRITVPSLTQGTEIHHPGGSPDVPAISAARGWLLPTDLFDLPIDASAGVIATTVSISHRGRAPPAVGNGI